MTYTFDTNSSWFLFHTYKNNLNRYKSLYIMNLEIILKSIELDGKVLEIDKKLEIGFNDIGKYNSKEFHKKYGMLKIHSIDMKEMKIRNIRFLLHNEFSMTWLYQKVQNNFNVKLSQEEFEDEIKTELEKEIFRTGTIKDVYAVI